MTEETNLKSRYIVWFQCYGIVATAAIITVCASPHHVPKVPSYQGSEVTLATRVSQSKWGRGPDHRVQMGKLCLAACPAWVTQLETASHLFILKLIHYFLQSSLLGLDGPWNTVLGAGQGDGVCNYGTWCVTVERSVEEGVLTSSFSGPCSFWALDQLFPPSVPPCIFLCCRHWHSQHAECWQPSAYYLFIGSTSAGPSSICLEEAGQEVPINALYIPGLDSLATEMQKEDFLF